MNQTLYLVDNNALIALRRRRVQTPFFRAHCRVTEDVLHEAAEHPDRSVLASNTIKRSPLFLEAIRTVMSGITAGDTSLIDLYANKGAADPGMIAAVHAALTEEEGMMFGDAWVIVTNDHAVEATAAGHGIRTMKPGELAELIDAACARETWPGDG